MRTLVGWDNAEEADLLGMYLGMAEDKVAIELEPDGLIERAESNESFDVILMLANHPDPDTAFETFQRLQYLRPETPIVGACASNEVYRVARFLTSGLRSYLIRDESGDYMFMLQAVLEAAVRAVEAERERQIAHKLRQEIDSVRQLQESIIPRDLHAPAGYHIVARYESSQIRVVGGRPVTMAGGDYYDAFVVDDDNVIMLVGDASGHGMKACMSIMTMHTLIRMIRSNQFHDTSEFVADVNRNLSEQSVVSEDGGFITLLYGILNPKTHELQWTSAGHSPPLLHNLSENTITPLGDHDTSGLPLGIVTEAEYTVQTSLVPPDSRVLFYTDGIIEAFPPGAEIGDHREFGEDGLERTLRASRELSLEETLQKLFDDSLAFTGGEGRHDDTSVLLLERRAQS